ncbi:hypothetical protein BX666DRAFT_2028055 [Dichotomocladium elegans]|nr:hypothetical protein BX666DRAFT_2028055 [Dichotomocladium elegans]
MQGTIWKTGSMATIAWNGINTDTLPYITLAQALGDGEYYDVAKLASGVPASLGKFSVKVPANIVSSTDYVLLIGDSENILCQSGPLTVMNDGTAPSVDQMNTSVEPVGTKQIVNTLVPVTTPVEPYSVSGLGNYAALPEATTSHSQQSLPKDRSNENTVSRSSTVYGVVETNKTASIGASTEANMIFVGLALVAMIAAIFQ